jgi:DNA-directed RNA polymerase specialized sigma24 family protein
MDTRAEGTRDTPVTLGVIAAGSNSSPIAFAAIGVVVSGAVFGGPLLETRRRARSVRVATTTTGSAGGPMSSGYERLVDAEQQRAFRIAALMTGRSDRAKSIVAESFKHVLQRWTRLPKEARVQYVLSSVVKQSIGDAFVGALGGPALVPDGISEPDEHLRRAARALAVLEPKRRAVVILSEREGFSSEEIATLVGLEPERVEDELARGLDDLRPVLAGAVA